MPNYNLRYRLWDRWGFTQREAEAFTSQYSVANMRSLPYLISMARWRRLYSSNLSRRGYDFYAIQHATAELYRRKGWLTPDGDFDPWRMLKAFRNQAIDSGDYIPSRRSHHSRAEITQSELRAQQKQIEIQRQINRDVFGR